MKHCVTCHSELAHTTLGDLCVACALGSSITAERDCVGDYERFQVLGEGAMGVVYLAKHVTSDEVVALKLAKRELVNHPHGLRAFRQQTKLESALQHPNIVPVRDVGTHDGLPFTVMPLMEGGTLADPENVARLDDPRAQLTLLLEVGRALQFAHERGVLHCDVKPENILFDAGFRAHLSDFGLARSLLAAEHAAGFEGGTPGWMSPEQVRREALTTASDVFALGVLLHWLGTGKLPFGAEQDFESRLLNDPVPPLRSWTPELEWGLEAIAHQALQKDAARRYATAEALVQDLERLRADHVIRAGDTPFWGRGWYWAQRHPGTRNALFILVPGFALLLLLTFTAQRAELRRAVLDMNAYAASGQAAAVLYQLRDYSDAIQRAAADPAVRALSHGPARAQTPSFEPGQDACRSQVALEDSAPLAPYASKFTTLLVLDAEGCARARVSAEPSPPNYVRSGYAWRDYFSAASTSGAASTRASHVGKAYRSAISLQIKFPVSTSLIESGRAVGVVMGSMTAASTLQLPRMRRAETADQMTVLIGPFEGEGVHETDLTRTVHEYAFLVHPRLNLGQKVTLDSAEEARLEGAFRSTEKSQFELDTVLPLQRADYIDPLLGGRWLAAFAPVGRTGYVVVVQTRDAVAVRPSNGLFRLALLFAFSWLTCTLLWLWLFLWRRTRERAG